MGDPRMNRKKVHKMETSIYISIAAVICGAQSWNEIEEFGNAKIAFFKQKTAYEIASGDWSSDVCSSDLFVVTQKFNLTFGEFNLTAIMQELCIFDLACQSFHLHVIEWISKQMGSSFIVRILRE